MCCACVHKKFIRGSSHFSGAQRLESVLYWLNEAYNILYFSYKKYSLIYIRFLWFSSVLIPLFYWEHLYVLGVLAGLKLEAQGTEAAKVVAGEPTSVWKQKK